MSEPHSIDVDKLISLRSVWPKEGAVYWRGELIRFRIEDEKPLLGLPGKKYTVNGKVKYVWKRKQERA